MAQTVQLTLVIHNHQPVGNFDHVFNEACDRAYLPFLRTLREFPAVRIGLHTSGSLWEWLEAHRKDYGELVAELLASGQVELLGGGMYEPILPVLPYRDALWQLERMNRFIEERFGVTPVGLWVPERVWEPQLPDVIHRAGLRYCLLDDFHFASCAPEDQVKTDYFVTGQGSAEVALLPIAKQLRYTMPFKPVEETLAYLRELMAGAEQPPLAVFGDDGEKFGIWPDTYDWVYEQGWLRDFFQALTDNQDWIQLMLPREVLEQRQPAGAVYIPTRSYNEMGEWTRIDPDATEDDPPGHWRNFFAKYPESREMYLRMCEVSDELYAAGACDTPAMDDLGRAQCNCSYWHGVFGGLYLNYLRQAISHHLLKAEQSIVGAKPASSNAAAQHAGAELDSTPTSSQVVGVESSSAPARNRLHNSELSITVKPEHGLAIGRVDYYPTLFSWTDVLARRREAYHHKLAHAHTGAHEEHASIHDIVRVKEPGLEERLIFDPHPRHSFVTYFCKADAADQFMFRPTADHPAPEFAHSDWYVPATNVEQADKRISAEVSQGDFTVRKSVILDGSTVTMRLQLVGVIPAAAGEYFVEFNLTALTDQAEDRYLEVNAAREPLSQGTDHRDVTRVALVDGWQRRRAVLTAPQPARLISYPIYTVSSSEGGFERTYQGTCIMLGFAPQTAGDLALTLSIEEL
jgi:4-alpha-glucanotransferase